MQLCLCSCAITLTLFTHFINILFWENECHSFYRTCGNNKASHYTACILKNNLKVAWNECLCMAIVDKWCIFYWVRTDLLPPPITPWIGGSVGLRASLDSMEKRKFFTLPGLKTPTPQSSSQQPVVIPTALSWLLISWLTCDIFIQQLFDKLPKLHSIFGVCDTFLSKFPFVGGHTHTHHMY
jgi:hypothetical protein